MNCLITGHELFSYKDIKYYRYDCTKILDDSQRLYEDMGWQRSIVFKGCHGLDYYKHYLYQGTFRYFREFVL